jgi:hypothetical protein
MERVKQIDPQLKYDGWENDSGTNHLYRVITPDGKRAVLKVTSRRDRSGLQREASSLRYERENLPRMYRTYNLDFSVDYQRDSAILKEWIDGQSLKTAPTTSQIYNQFCNILSSLRALPQDFREDQFIVDCSGKLYCLDLEEIPRPTNFYSELQRIGDLRQKMIVLQKREQGKGVVRANLEAFLQRIVDPIDTKPLEPQLREDKIAVLYRNRR